MARHLIPVSVLFLAVVLGGRLLGLPGAGPLAVALSCALAVFLVRRAGEGWDALGLARRTPWWRTLLVGVGLALLGYAVAVAATLLAVRGLGWAPMQLDRLAGVQGSLPGLLGMLAIAWTTAALGEELLFRGFLQGRLQRLFGDGRGAGLAAAGVQALLFGLAHAYQGPTGVLVSGSLGLCFGWAMLRTRSLWPLVVAHGLIDTLSLLALYAGALPTA